MDLAKIEGDELVIRLPMDVLVTATVACPELEDYDEEAGDFRKVEITDPKAWMQAVVHELNDEAEDGTTMVHLMFDRAFSKAVDQGAEGILIGGE